MLAVGAGDNCAEYSSRLWLAFASECSSSAQSVAESEVGMVADGGCIAVEADSSESKRARPGPSSILDWTVFFLASHSCGKNPRRQA
jgi:hypothetical protein